MARRRKLAIRAIFLHFKEHKAYQGTLGTLEVILVGPGRNLDGLFLSATSSSRSDIVTKSVRVSVRTLFFPLVSLKSVAN